MTVAVHKDQEMAAHWKTQIEMADKAFDKWRKRADKIGKNYRDERDEQDKGVAKRLNLFWSNTETLKPAIYSKTPVAIVERRFLDKDTIGKSASMILERALRYEISMCGLDRQLRKVRDDYLLPGRGQLWIRYNPKFGDPISPKQQGDDEITFAGDQSDAPQDESRVQSEETQERELLSESLDPSYVNWRDFYFFPPTARTWDEVEGVGRRLRLSRQDCIDNFGDDVGKKIELDFIPKADGDQRGESLLSGQEGMQATIHEIWWRPLRKVYFVAQGYDKLCKEEDDPLKLEQFFPCPEPISATMTNDSFIPVPDYAEAQDQYIQIDDLTKRIDILTNACKVSGAYDASQQALKRVFQEAQEPNLIPVDSWAMFAEKGGISGAISLVDIKQIAEVLQTCIEVRAKVIEDLDRLTGMPDILRGTSDARETLGGQRLQNNNSKTRLSDRQDEMARFCRDVICLMGEIISEHFSDETLIQVSGAIYDEGLDPPELPAQAPPAPAMQPPGAVSPPALPPPQSSAGPNPGAPAGPNMPAMASPPMVPAPQPMPEPPEQKLQRKLLLIQQAIQLLRNDKLRGFRIDIETDSTVQADAETEKQARTEYLTVVTKFIETSAQVTAQVPEFAPLAAKMLMFGVRGFRVGRDLESAIEDFCDKAEKQAKDAANKPPKPTPEDIKMQTEQIRQQGEARSQEIEAQSEQTNAQIRMQEAATKQQGEERRAQLEYQSKMLDIELKKLELQIAQLKAHGEIEKTNLEVAKSRQEFEHGQVAHQQELEGKAVDRQFRAEDHERTMQAKGGAKEHANDDTKKHGEMLTQLHEHISSPIEFVRDGSGRLSHVKKGKVVHKVSRDERGLVSGLVN